MVSDPDLVRWLRFHLAFLYQPRLAQEILERLGGPEAAVAALDAGKPPPGAEDLLAPARSPAIAL